MHIPEGYKLVPLVPTVEMLAEIHLVEAFTHRAMTARYQAMLKAAPVPPKVEAQPEAYQYQGRDGKWRGFVNEQHYHSTVADGTWPIRALYTHSDEGVANSNHKLLMDGACGEIALLEQERDALQQRLTDAEKRVSELDSAAREMLRIAGIANQGSNAYIRAIINLNSALKPAAEGKGS